MFDNKRRAMLKVKGRRGSEFRDEYLDAVDVRGYGREQKLALPLKFSFETFSSRIDPGAQSTRFFGSLSER